MSEIVSVNFDEILAAFERDPSASHTPGGSAREDECILAAERGWHRCSPSAAWPIGAENAVRDYLRDDLTEDVLAAHGGGATRWALFASYAAGWLFCLQDQGRLDEISARNAFAVLPGFMWLHEERVAGPGRPSADGDR